MQENNRREQWAKLNMNNVDVNWVPIKKVKMGFPYWKAIDYQFMGTQINYIVPTLTIKILYSVASSKTEKHTCRPCQILYLT